jgi:carnitine O-palmitoyltransferase 2
MTDRIGKLDRMIIWIKVVNRWFDKCFQLIVDAQGIATINFEHSWGDGVAVLRLMESTFADTNKHHFVGPNQKPKTTTDISRNIRQLGMINDYSYQVMVYI